MKGGSVVATERSRSAPPYELRRRSVASSGSLVWLKFYTNKTRQRRNNELLLQLTPLELLESSQRPEGHTSEALRFEKGP